MAPRKETPLSGLQHFGIILAAVGLVLLVAEGIMSLIDRSRSRW